MGFVSHIAKSWGLHSVNHGVSHVSYVPVHVCNGGSLQMSPSALAGKPCGALTMPSETEAGRRNPCAQEGGKGCSKRSRWFGDAVAPLSNASCFLPCLLSQPPAHLVLVLFAKTLRPCLLCLAGTTRYRDKYNSIRNRSDSGFSVGLPGTERRKQGELCKCCGDECGIMD